MKRRLILSSIVFALLVAVVFTWLLIRPSKLAADATLVATQKDEFRFAIGAPRWSRFVFLLSSHFFKPKITYSFPPRTNRVSIDGLLTECHDITGKQFFIDKAVALGTVNYGYSNVLTGPQWVSAFTNALQTGTPEWWDEKRQAFRRENLIIRPYGSKAFLVLPRDRAGEYND